MPAGLLQAMVEAARATTGADSARLLLLSPDGRSTVVAAVSGRVGVPPGSRRPLEEGLGGWVIRNHRAILVSSLQRRRCYPRSALDFAISLRGSESAVAVPISDPVSGTCLGALAALSPHPMAFRARSVRVLDLFAQVAGSALTATARERELRETLTDRQIQQERNDLLVSLVEKVHEGVALVDRQGIVRYSNPAFGRLFGLSAKDLVGSSADSLLRQGEPADDSGDGEPEWNGDQFELVIPDPTAPRVIRLSRNSFEYGRSRIPGWIVTARDTTDRARWEARLRHQGEHDDLTGLPNRHQLQRRLAAVTGASPPRPEAGVFFIDLDGTKTVNDALGHEAGDDLLRAVAGRLLARIRPGDLLARYGGDELVALIEPLPAQEAPAFAERLLSAFSDPIRLKGQVVAVTASAGFTSCREGSDPASLLREADSAMYAAKRAGGNAWRAYEADLHDAALAELRLSSELRAALDDPEASGLHLVYQPLVHLGHGYCTGVEALMRWHHPRLGMVSPPQVVEIARRLHELERLSDWILDQALSDLAGWGSQGIDQLILGVNFAPTELTDPGFCDRVLASLGRHGIPSDRLVVEITEHELGPQLQPRVATTVQELAEHGVLSALDDVGSGQSNLARLVDLPVKILKVDRVFVMGLPGDRRSSAVIRAFLSVGRDLDMDVVAEGVETRAQEVALRSYGCEIVQGFRYSKPLRAPALADWMLPGPDHGSRLGPPREPGRPDLVRVRPGRRSA